MPTRLQLDFAAAWLARDIRPFNAWHYANGKPDHLACWERPTGWALTPAGADILATIDALDIDPATARADDDPKLELAQVCATCNGSREVQIIGSFMNPCPDCAKVCAVADAAREDYLTPRSTILDFAKAIGFHDCTPRPRAHEFIQDAIYDPAQNWSLKYVGPNVLTGRTTARRGPEIQRLPRDYSEGTRKALRDIAELRVAWGRTAAPVILAELAAADPVHDLNPPGIGED